MGRYLRWQAAIALLGLLLLAALLRYAAYNFSSVTVPDRGGTYVEGVAGNPQYINPLLSHFNQVDGLLTALVFSGLTRLDEQGEVIPDLAESWAVSEDGLTYEFRLKPELRWHDGAPVRAADVLYTVATMQADEFPGVNWLNELWSTVEVSAPDGPDGLAVRFTLEQPLASFLDFTTIGLLPEHLWKDVPPAQLTAAQLNTRPVGTGPFMLRQITATQAQLVPNPDLEGPVPYLAGITFRFYPDHQSLFPAYERGEIDGISWIWPADVEDASRHKDLQLFSAPMPGYTLVYLNLQNANIPFLQEVDVRKALMLALDRQSLIDTALNGQGLVAHTPVLPDTWAYDPEAPQYRQNLAEARQLLDAAGWQDTDGDGVRDKEGVQLAFVLLGNNRPLIEALAAQWEAIGVQAVPQAVTLAGLIGDFLVPRTYDAAVVDWELAGDPDPYPLWHSTQREGGQNYAGWEDRKADEAMEQARAVSDRALRAEFYKTFQQRFAEEVPALMLYHPVYTFGVQDTVRGVTVGPMNRPADRFRTFKDWYIVTRRITVGNQGLGTGLDTGDQ